MEILGQPAWTLNARRDGGAAGAAIEFLLGDGRRMALRARLAASTEQHPADSAARLLGSQLAARLTASVPRPLLVQVDDTLDAIDWEGLTLDDGARLGERFGLARLPLVDGVDAPLVPELPLAEALTLAVIDRSLPSAPALLLPQAPHLLLDALAQPDVRDRALGEQVLVLADAGLGELFERVALPLRQRLLVLAGAQPVALLAQALDAGASVLVLPGTLATQAEALQGLTQQLAGGLSVGAAVRALYGRAVPAGTRLYGAPELRFVRPRPPASRRQVSSLSFDLAGSTTVMQRLGDEAYAEMLARLHARATEIVRRHHGQPDDPQGDDGVMSYFGHPQALEDAASHAVRAGLEIAKTVSELGVSVRAGIATGLVAIHAGQPVGLSIHRAARLQQMAVPGTLLVAESTRQLILHAFELERVAHQAQLKGIDGAEDVWRVLGPIRDARLHRLERGAAGLTPLVGRDAELARLEANWERLDRGECRLVLLCAEAGMGKSRVMREFRDRLLRRDVRVLELHCRSDASASPYLVLAEALKRWAGIGALDNDALALRKLAEALPPAWSEGDALDLLGALLGLGLRPASSDAQQQHAGRTRQRLLAVLLDWFALFQHDQACCLLIEDWHWVDPSTREFVEQLGQRDSHAGPGLMALLASRTDAQLPAPRRGSVERIDLAGLSAEAARELVRVVRLDSMLPPDLVATLAARGDGVPLFLEEATRMAHERGVELLATVAIESVPASLQDLLMARLDAVGAAKSLAQVAAVLGREFTLPPLAALLEGGRFGIDPGSLAEPLAMLEASGLVRREGAELYAFKHALVRDAAYASLWARDRQALHAHMVELLQRRWPELAERQPELLAHHQTEAGQHADALAQWELAARNASARSAQLESISHLRRALALLARGEDSIERQRTALRLQLMLAARLIVTEGYGADAVLEAYEEAGRLSDALGEEGERFKIEMGLEAYRFMRADFGPALAHGQRAADIAEASGDVRQRLHAHWGLACTLFHQGNLRGTMGEMELALSLYGPELHRSFGVQDPGVMCMAYSSWCLWELGRPDAAVERIERAVEMAAGFEHKFSQAVVQAYRVSVYLLRGDDDTALALADSCIAFCEEGGFPVWLAITRCMRGHLLCKRGEFETGIAEMRAGYALWLSTGSMVSQPLYLALQAEGLALAGELDAADDCIAQGLAIAERYGERQYEAELRRLRGELALRRGSPAEAEAWLRAGYVLAMRQHRIGIALRCAISLARLWRPDAARAARGRRLLRTLLARWDEGRGTRDVREAIALCELEEAREPR